MLLNEKNELIHSNLYNQNSEYYSDKKFLPEKTTLYEMKQLVVAKSKLSGYWMRARINEIFEYSNVEHNQFLVNI